MLENFDWASLIPTIDTIKILSIPIIAALVGFVTNWLAIKFMFYPIKFVGIPPYIGWQGIVPRKAEKIARLSLESVLTKLGGLPFFFEKMNPRLIAQQIAENITPKTDFYVDKVINESVEGIWKRTPTRIKKLIYSRVKERIPQLSYTITYQISHQVEQLLSLDEFVIKRIIKDKPLLNRFFIECGDKELDFIIRSGWWLGGLFGVVQAIVWYFFSDQGWLLPFFGMLVGFATNWIALKIIFRPTDPVQIGPFSLQGMYIKRRDEVAELYSRLVAEELFPIEEVMKALLYGRYKQRTHNLILECIKDTVDESLGVLTPVLNATGQGRQLLKIRGKFTQETINLSYEAVNNKEFCETQAETLAAHMEIEMKKLSNEEYENLLHPAFKEDEYKLILIGAALGFCAGFLQLVWVFGGQLL